jgi:hypothetical protein
MAGSRTEGVIWLKAIAKAGLGLHSNLCLYFLSFCETFYQDDELVVRATSELAHLCCVMLESKNALYCDRSLGIKYKIIHLANMLH